MFLWLSIVYLVSFFAFFFYFKQKTAYEVRISDWSSDVCSSDLTVHAKGIQIRYRHYWHPMLAARIGQRVEISWDERTIQHIYADLDGRYVELPVVGDYPDVWEADWEAARAGVRAL